MARLSGKAGDVYVATQLIEDCEDTWDEQVIGNVTDSSDTSDYKVGAASAKFVVDAAFTTGVIGSEVVASMNLAAYNQIMCWVKSSINMAADIWAILLDDHANCASPVVSPNIPALTAGEWKYIKVAADLSGCTAIISVGLNQSADQGPMNFWIDDLRAAARIAGIKSWSLEQRVDPIETTGFDSSGHRTYIPALSGWAGSFEGYKDGAPLTIGSIVGIELRKSATATQQYRGNAIITGLSVNVTVEGLVEYSYEFQGTDSLVIATT